MLHSSSRVLMLSFSLLPLLGCQGSKADTKLAPPAPEAGTPVVAAEVDGEQVTTAEVDQKIAGSLTALRRREFDLRRQALDTILGEKLLAKEAKRRGVTVAELLKTEVETKAQSPGTAEIDAIYTQYAAQFRGKTREEAAAEITKVLRQRSADGIRQGFQRELRQKSGLKVFLVPPLVALKLSDKAPQIGPANAPVTVVEFLDYQCPYCVRADPTILQLVKEYGDKMRFVHRDFPIDGHPRAFAAARAARCAGEQGRFWEYHRSLFAKPAGMDDADLRSRAAELALNVEAFSSCYVSGRHDEDIRASEESGLAAGVESTPTFFVNGQMLVGAKPIEEFREAIDAALRSPGN
jgi:protein-disulfide isomerase